MIFHHPAQPRRLIFEDLRFERGALADVEETAAELALQPYEAELVDFDSPAPRQWMLHLSANFNGTLRHGAPVVSAIALQCSLALPAFMAATQRAM